MFEKNVTTVSAGDYTRFSQLDTAKATAQDKTVARQLLEGIASSIVSADDRSVRAGNLRLYAGPNGEAQLTLKRFSRNENNTQANDLIRKLVSIAYANHPRASEALEAYLQTSGNKMGSQSLFKLVKSHSTHEAAGNASAVPDALQQGDWRRSGFFSREARISNDYLKPAPVEIAARQDAPENSREQLIESAKNSSHGEDAPLDQAQNTLGNASFDGFADLLSEEHLSKVSETEASQSFSGLNDPLQIEERGQANGLLDESKGASPSEVLANLRKDDPVAARQAMAELFSNMTSTAAKEPSFPLPGQINHIAGPKGVKLLQGKPDLSDSVTLLDLWDAGVKLGEMNLKNAQLLIRPSSGPYKPSEAFGVGHHWGVDLSGADLENTHIELDLSFLQEAIDSGEIHTARLASGLLQNTNSTSAPVGPGGGGVVGMIASIPSRFPALRVALTEQLLDFLNQHPSQAAKIKVAGWPVRALCVVSLVDQFPELRNNPKVAEAAKLFANGISMNRKLGDLVGAIKDPTRPSTLLVRFGLDGCLAVGPEARKQFFVTNSEHINVLLDYAERVDDSHPEAIEIKRLASELEKAYLATEPFASLSKPFTEYDEKVRVLLSHDKKLNQSSALVIPGDHFQSMLLNPREVRWDALSASRFDPNNPLGPQFIETKILRTDLPSLVAKFPIVKAAYDSASTNAASRAISKLFHASPDVQKMMTAFLDRGVRATALGAEEVSDVFSRALEPIYQDFQPIYDLEKWPEARLKPDHLEQLLALAKAEGLGDNKTAFARYLFVMSAALLKMSSYKGYGSDDISVTSLRFYAHSLIREAERLAPSLNIKFNSYENLQNFEKDVRSAVCAEIISSDMITGAKKDMPHSSHRVLPNHLSLWRQKPSAPDENANLPAEVVY